MRKVSSAPNLSALGDSNGIKRFPGAAQHNSIAPAPLPAAKPFLGRRLAQQPNKTKVSEPMTSSDKRSSQVARAFALVDHPPYTPDPGTFQFMQTVLAEASSKGVLGAECFIAMGVEMTDAPELVGNTTPIAGSQQEIAMRDLAACLAEPQVVEERGVMETIQSRINQLAARNNIEVQLRYVEETRLADDQDQEPELKKHLRRRALLREARLRRKRSFELEDLDSQLLLELLSRSSKAPFKPAESEPPSAELLQVAFASLDESANTLQLEEDPVPGRSPAIDAAFTGQGPNDVLVARPEPEPEPSWA